MALAFGLIGYPLTHSFSPAYFSRKFVRLGIDASYHIFPLPDISAFPALLHEYPDLRGLNVTIPYKTEIIPYLHSLSPEARAVGAVNTISLINGLKIGYNTDITGFEQSLRPLLQPQHQKALVLGTGGAALAVAYVLRRLGIPFTSVSRSRTQQGITYADITPAVMASHRLIINTTPLGMFPFTDTCPALLYDCIGPEHLLYDLIYNPEETRFLSMGKERGAAIKNGIEMLELQAEAAWNIWQRDIR